MSNMSEIMPNYYMENFRIAYAFEDKNMEIAFYDRKSHT